MKFTIVTPTFNSERFLAETMQSVISQKGDFAIEYLIVDNSSRDDTIGIVKSHQKMIGSGDYKINCNSVSIQYHSKTDCSMYDAINYGFSRATGDVFAWINSDDIYLPGALNIICQSLKKYPEIKWIKGITSYINEYSTLYMAGRCYLYNRDWIKKGVYGKDAYFIQQDSVFWRSGLWNAVGGIDLRFKKAGDYSLWIHFSQYAPLYTVKAYISCFRKVEGQLSQDIASYMKEYDLIPAAQQYPFLRRIVKAYFSHESKIRSLRLRKLAYRIMFGKQDLLLIDIINGADPQLKTVSYYAVN